LSVAAAIAAFSALALLAVSFPIASAAHGVEVVGTKSLPGHRHDVHVAMFGMLVTDGEPLNPSAEVLLESRHDLLCPRPQVKLARRVLMLRVGREHHPVHVVVLLDAIDALIGAGLPDASVAIPHLAILALALLVTAVDGVAHVALGQLQRRFQPATVARFHDGA
jgi:hypothetical protein